MIKFGANILSQTVQRNLGRATLDLAASSERLASGQRINKASDDAAGLAISTKLDKDKLLTHTARRNISDGISMVNILTSGLSSQKDILFRMAELAEQSANGVYSSKQREALQKEYSSLMDEFDRIGDTTEFNGIKLLRNPTAQTIQFMAGITGADTSFIQVAAANSHRFAGTLVQKSDINEDGFVNASDVVNMGLTVPKPRDQFWEANNPASNHLFDTDVNDAGEVVFFDSLGRKGSLTFILTRVRGDQGYETKYDPLSAMDITENANRQDIMGYAVSGTGENVSISTQIDTSGTIPQAYQLNFTFASSGASASINLDFSGLRLGIYDIASPTYRPSAIGFTNILNKYSSRRALESVTNRIDDLSSFEGQYGALVSRLSVAHSVLGASGENLAAASSRIKDADVANESSVAIRSGILQQTAAAVLAQANQAPQVALSLLRNI